MTLPGVIVRPDWLHYFAVLVNKREGENTSRNEGLYLIVDHALDTCVHGSWREYPVSVFSISIWALTYRSSTEIVHPTLVRP